MTQSKRIHLPGYSQASSDRPAAASGFHGQHPPGNVQKLDPNHSTSWTQNNHLVAVVEFYDWQNINNTPKTLVYIRHANTFIKFIISSLHFHSLLDDTGESKVCDLPWKKICVFCFGIHDAKKRRTKPWPGYCQGPDPNPSSWLV